MKYIIVSLSVLFSLQATAQHHHPERPSTHGMLAFGKKKTYFSHLPMFHAPHDYQVIFEGETDIDLNEIKASAAAQNTIITIMPERFTMAGFTQKPHPFKADVYLGHFERGGQLAKKSVTVTPTKMIYAKKFDGIRLPFDQHVFFGEGDEFFAAHVISAAPDFDMISEAYKERASSFGIGKQIYFEEGDLR